MISPEMKFAIVSFAARPTARPATPRPASIESTLKPSWDAAMRRPIPITTYFRSLRRMSAARRLAFPARLRFRIRRSTRWIAQNARRTRIAPRREGRKSASLTRTALTNVSSLSSHCETAGSARGSIFNGAIIDGGRRQRTLSRRDGKK
jgi:hypothetical protein